MKSIKFPFAKGPLADAICRDGGGILTPSILEGTVDMRFVNNIYHSVEMRNFVLVLQRPISKLTVNEIPPFDYTLDSAS